MIDELFPDGVPNGFQQIGRFWFIGCDRCSRVVAVVYSYPDEPPVPRAKAFMDLAAAFSGAMVEEFNVRKIAGVIVTPNVQEPERLWTWVIYPEVLDPVPMLADDLIDRIGAVAVQITAHSCRHTTLSA